ncbi:MAG: zf-TFIIB domain-containing protein [Acidobacteriota bacterium]|nr:zf-TFIIB domain-containing protein [Acidobacteriota bacterium]
MLCPKCNENMVLETIKGFEVEQCPQCKGHWLDRVTVSGILDQTGSPFAAAAFETSLSQLARRDTDLACPHCEEGHLACAELQGVGVEICATCLGIFFDLGEVGAVRAVGADRSWDTLRKDAFGTAGELATNPEVILEILLRIVVAALR